jgi:hypothetical protein
MVRHLVLVVVVALASDAQASAVEDALQAVHDAQRASDEGAACKGLSTKLKLAVEALEHVRKAPAPGVIRQAKGRLEAAKDLASTACAAPVQAKVTGALASAIAALENAGPAKVEKTGLAFGAACRASDACASDNCFVGAQGDGYCTKPCEAASECPTNWQCRRIHSDPQKICTK